MSFTKLDYCQYLLSTQVNYTLTHLAEHLQMFSHDTINRYLRNEEITPQLLWDNVKKVILPCAQAYLIFDDTVLDKSYSTSIELTRRQYSGNTHAVIRGIGLVSCIYVNPETDQFWIIDYRIYHPEGDNKNKLDHVKDMLQGVFEHKKIPFQTVLMDSWYATTALMLRIDDMNKTYYCPIKKNRLVDDTLGKESYKRVEDLTWDENEISCGKVIKVKRFPGSKRVKLFRVVVSSDKTEYVVTNNMSQNSLEAVQKECRFRWKVEEFHREIKQLTGIESCQCRKGRIQRNHIGCALLVWLRLKDLAYRTGQTIYQLKRGLLSRWLIQELKQPAIPMTLA